MPVQQRAAWSPPWPWPPLSEAVPDLRSAFAFWFLGAWTALCFPAALIAAALGGGRLGALVGRRLWSPPLLRAAGARLVTLGGEKVDFSRPAVFACNHQGMLDIPALLMSLPADLRFIAKRSLRQ